MLQSEILSVGILKSSMPLFPKDHFQVNNYVLTGTEGTLVWDTLLDPRAISEQSAAYTHQPVTAVYSHADWDHCLGTDGFQFTEVIAHKDAFERFSTDLPLEIRKVGRKQAPEWITLRPVPPTITFTSKMKLEFGSFHVELISLGGHTSDSIVGIIPEFKLLLAGDALETIPVVNDAASVKGWSQALEKLSQRIDFEQILPGHGNPTDRALLYQNIDYLSKLSNGTPFEIEDKGPFYRKTHRDNLQRMRNFHEQNNQ
jgi:glyoxylase-like metal-dependent hydrolase (beta-lactamase superfamily II)